MNNKPWYLSSSGAEKLSSSIKGFFSLGVISAIVMILKLVGVDLDVSDLNALTEDIGSFIVAIGGLGSSAYALWGVLRRLRNKALKLGKYADI